MDVVEQVQKQQSRDRRIKAVKEASKQGEALKQGLQNQGNGGSIKAGIEESSQRQKYDTRDSCIKAWIDT